MKSGNIIIIVAAFALNPLPNQYMYTNTHACMYIMNRGEIYEWSECRYSVTFICLFSALCYCMLYNVAWANI